MNLLSYKHYLLLLCLLMLTGCMSVQKATQFKPHSEAFIQPTYFDVAIPSFDGTRIQATVYQPSLKPHQTAPVIIHAHGFGTFRMSRPLSLYGKFVFSGQTSLQAWKEGYWVVSFDHRGHGASEGQIHFLDDSYELKDISYLIDWIEANIPRIAYEDGNPLIGMIGESYGGGAQLLSAGLDHRIDAIVPVTTWNDLNKSLAPEKIPKMGWLTTLIVTSNFLNPGNVHKLLNDSYFVARGGTVPPKLTETLSTRSIAERCSQVNGDENFSPKADALLIQGFRDVLFPVNEAVKNAECLKAHGRDARIIATQDGHLLPFTQFTSKLVSGYNIEDYVHCGNRKLKTTDLALSWFDEKLKGVVGAADVIPSVCLTHDYKTGSVFTQVPQGGTAFKIPETQISSGMAGLFEAPLNFFEAPINMLQKLSAWVLPEKDQGQNINIHKRGGKYRPAFVPLYQLESDAMMAGIPTASLTINSNQKTMPRLFVGLGIKTEHSRTVTLVSDQVFPINGIGLHQLELPAMSTRLRAGDIVGLVVSGYSNQYRFSGSGMRTKADLAGNIEIPIFGIENADDQFLVQAYSDN